jgi:hypothetical protein
MMTDIPINELRAMSASSIQFIIKRCNEELERRRREERCKLIEEFKHAYNALRDAGIGITYCEEWDDDPARLCDWDGFSFD